VAFAVSRVSVEVASMHVTAFYAALLGLLFIVLSVRVIRQRRDAKVSLGDGGNSAILRRMRVQANFAEYVPIALVLLGLAESLGTPAWLLNAVGLTLLLGRLAHAYGVSRSPEPFSFRVAGMMATFTAIALAAVLCLWGALR
jgi:uncharacterized membrane protein YecN with MAPEG domain